MGQALSGGGGFLCGLGLRLGRPGFPGAFIAVFEFGAKTGVSQSRRRRAMTSHARRVSLPGRLSKDGALQLQHASRLPTAPETHERAAAAEREWRLHPHAMEREVRSSTAPAAEETTGGESSWTQVWWAGTQ